MFTKKKNVKQHTLHLFSKFCFFLKDPSASLDLVDLDDTPAPDPVGTFAGWKRKWIYFFRLGESDYDINCCVTEN